MSSACLPFPAAVLVKYVNIVVAQAVVFLVRAGLPAGKGGDSALVQSVQAAAVRTDPEGSVSVFAKSQYPVIL
jgi:hypothetical protein